MAAATKNPFVEFHARDRFHALTYVGQGLPAYVSDEVKASLTAALEGLDPSHLGPVHVAIPAAFKPADDAPDDPALPKDGSFAVQRYDFVQV